MNIKADIYSPSTRKGLFLSVSILFLVTFFLRLLLAKYQVIVNDGTFYIRIARSYFYGGVNETTISQFFNLYPLLIAAAYKIAGNWETAGKMVSVFFGSFAVVPLYFLVRNMVNAKVGFMCCLLYAIHPHFVDLSTNVLREGTCWFFAFSALYLAWMGLNEKGWFYIVLSSAAAALAIFTRLDGIIIFIVIIAWIVWQNIFRIKNLKKGLCLLIIFLFALPLFFTPLLLVTKEKAGRLEYGHTIDKVIELFTLKNAGRFEPPQDAKGPSLQYSLFLDLAKRNRHVVFAAEVVTKFVKSMGFPLVIFFLFGIIGRSAIRRFSSEGALIIWFGVAAASMYLYVAHYLYLSTRHGLYLVMPALVWSGIGFYELKEKLNTWFQRKRYIADRANLFACSILILLLAYLFTLNVYYSVTSEKRELKTAGIALKQLGYTGITFIGQPNLMRVAFYADSDYVNLPDAIDRSSLESLVLVHKPKVLIIDEESFRGNYKILEDVLADRISEKVRLPAPEIYKNYIFHIYSLK
jgi:4-amino-4-deoxy-L-arabinose transferase-like glycosyltransferase